MLYFCFVLTMTLLLPLVLMVVSYLTIIILIYRRPKSEVFAGRSSSFQGMISRTRLRTIKMTGVLVMGFIICWTPYYSMTFW